MNSIHHSKPNVNETLVLAWRRLRRGLGSLLAIGDAPSPSGETSIDTFVQLVSLHFSGLIAIVRSQEAALCGFKNRGRAMNERAELPNGPFSCVSPEVEIQRSPQSVSIGSGSANVGPDPGMGVKEDVLHDRLAQENGYLKIELRDELLFEDIVGNSRTLRSVLKEIETVASTDCTVLIHGETGTGKELIACALHNLSSRKSNAFVKLNCAAIPTGLLESELFGSTRGAFSGSVADRAGLVRSN